RRGKSWPAVRLDSAGAVRIRYKAGYATPFTASTAKSTVVAFDHPYREGDRVRLWNSGGALPAPLKERTDYFVVNLNGNQFQVAESEGGAAVTITDTGAGTHFLGLIPENVRA